MTDRPQDVQLPRQPAPGISLPSVIRPSAASDVAMAASSAAASLAATTPAFDNTVTIPVNHTANPVAPTVFGAPFQLPASVTPNGGVGGPSTPVTAWPTGAQASSSATAAGAPLPGSYNLVQQQDVNMLQMRYAELKENARRSLFAHSAAAETLRAAPYYAELRTIIDNGRPPAAFSTLGMTDTMIRPRVPSSRERSETKLEKPIIEATELEALRFAVSNNGHMPEYMETIEKHGSISEAVRAQEGAIPEDAVAFAQSFAALQARYLQEVRNIRQQQEHWLQCADALLARQSLVRVVTESERFFRLSHYSSYFDALIEGAPSFTPPIDGLLERYFSKVIMLKERHFPQLKKRKTLSKNAVQTLRQWLFQNFKHPYPDDQSKQDLSASTGMTVQQVNNWFINARVRLWKPLMHKMLADNEEKQAAEGSMLDESTGSQLMDTVDDDEGNGAASSAPVVPPSAANTASIMSPLAIPASAQPPASASMMVATASSMTSSVSVPVSAEAMQVETTSTAPSGRSTRARKH